MTAVHALLLCDSAFIRADNGSWHVIGVFDRILAATPPAPGAPFAVFVHLVDFSGGQTVTLVIRDQAGAVVHAVRGEFPPLPVPVLQHAFPFPARVWAAGGHTLELLVDEELLAVRSFRVQTAAA